MSATPVGPDVRTEECPDGPTLVRGAVEVVDDDGTVHPVTRPVVALCTCRRSARMPWCDSTHKAVVSLRPQARDD